MIKFKAAVSVYENASTKNYYIQNYYSTKKARPYITYYKRYIKAIH